MNHLTDEQLSALLDDALPAGERAAADAHLAGCDACRARLAEASALEESLGRALSHDPGEAYFADFAARVERRIAAGNKPVSGQQSLWEKLTSSRGLTLAGSTAALVLTAGLAWMRFHSEGDATRALREASPRPVSERARQAPSSADQALPPPAEPAPSAPISRPPGITPVTGMRAERIPSQPSQAAGGTANDRLDERDSQASRAPVPAAAPVAGSTLAQMKRRAVAPAEKQDAASGALAKDQAVPAKEEVEAKQRTESEPAAQSVAPPAAVQNVAPPATAKTFAEPSAPPAATRALAPSKPADSARGQVMPQWGATGSHFRGGRADEVKFQFDGLTSLSPCGRVRDSRGRSIAGAEITAVHKGVRSTRTAPDGSFCLGSLKTGDTLTVLHVGFDPFTVVVDPTTSLAIELQPVGTLGPQSTMLLGKGQPPPSLSGALNQHAVDSAQRAPAADLYEKQPRGVRALVEEARAASAIAQRDHTVESHEKAAKAWADVALQVHGAPAFDSQFRYLTALRDAYHLAPTDERGSRLRSGLAAFVATAPASLPERATVQRWQAELNAPSDR